MAMDLASPLFPRAFLAMACLGSLARAVTGVAGGATRAALTQHFARQSNAADIAAKEQSQARMGSGRLLGKAGREMIDRTGQSLMQARACKLVHWAVAWKGHSRPSLSPMRQRTHLPVPPRRRPR